AGLGIQLDGAPGGDSGEVDLTTDSPVSGTLTVAAPVSARGGITSNAGSGGTVSLDAASTLRVDASLDVSALTGDAGEIDLNPNDENVDVVVNAKLDGSSASAGGVLSIGSSHDIEFTANSSVKMNAVGSVEGSGGPGGEVTLTGADDSTDLGVPSASLVIGRKAITVSGTLRATGGSNAAYSSTSPQTAGARIINPALGPCRMCTAGLIGTSCTRDADCDPAG